MALPAAPKDLTVDWLNEHLPPEAHGGRSVREVVIEDIGTGTGIFGQIARVRLDLGDGSVTSVVVKLPCLEPANLEVARILGLYEREMRMYAEVMGRTPVNVPRCWYAGRDDTDAFVLVLEDMGRDWQVGDQVTGATVGEAEAIVDVLAHMHAHWWERAELAAMTWLPTPDAPQYLGAVPGIYRAGLPLLRSDWADRVPPEAIDVATRVEPVFEELIGRTASGPWTLIHTDTRLDNVFFARDGSGRVALIDFQLALRGRGVADVAYLIGTSVPHAEARAHWERLLRRWLDRIQGHGIDYRWEDALTHYREAALFYLAGALSLVGTFDAGNERGRAMVEAYVTRQLRHVVDIGADAVL